MSLFYFRRMLRVALLCGGAASAAACSGGPPAADARPGAATKGGAKGGAPGAPGAPGGRGRGAVVLGASDVIEVREGPIESSFGISGNLRPIEEVTVRARVEGNITGVLAREGTRVTRGQLLARFEDVTQRGDQASATAEVESAKSDVANAQWNADQSQELFKAGAIAERDLRTAQQTLVAARSRLAAAEARLNSMSQNVSDTRIQSPTSGVVSVRSVEPGEHVSRGATLFTVVRSDVLELEAAIPARNAPDVKTGQPVRFFADGREFGGRVARVSPTINPSSRSLTLYVEVPNGDGSLKGNAFATGRMIGRRVAKAILAPTSTIRQSQTDARQFVYAIADGKVDRRFVSLGIVDDLTGMTQVTEGLAVGDRIIGGNIGTLGNGTQVSIAAREGGRGTDGARPATGDSAGAGRQPSGAGPAGPRGRSGDSGGRPPARDSSARR